MNWFTKKIIADNSLSFKKERAGEDSACEHVEADVNLAFALRREMDSFGPVSSYVCCLACDDKADEEESSEKHTCADCGSEFPLKDGVLWRWYDFYAAQGDEALPICNKCRVAEKHRNRLRRDTEDCEEELGRYDRD